MSEKRISGVKDRTGEIFPESVRRFGAALMMWAGWLGGLFLFTYALFNYNPSEGRFAPQWLSFSFFLCLFIAVAGTLVRSRMRLSDTIIAALKTGAEMNQQQTNTVLRTIERKGSTEDC